MLPSELTNTIGLYRDVWIAAIASSRKSLATQTAAICVRFHGRRVRHVYVTMQITFLARKSALIYRRGLRQRVASLTIDCNGVFAIRAYFNCSLCMSCLVLSRLVSSRLVSPRLASSRLVSSRLVLSCMILCSTAFCRLSNDSQRRITQRIDVDGAAYRLHGQKLAGIAFNPLLTHVADLQQSLYGHPHFFGESIFHYYLR